VGLRLVIAEDSYLIRKALQQLLTGAPALEIVAVCEDAYALLEAIERERPDVVVSDIRMPPFHKREGLDMAVRLRKTHPGIGVVILTQHADPAHVLELFESGSEGRAYLLKEHVGDLTQLVAAIEAVAAGRSSIDARIVDVLFAERARVAASPLDELTAREREVLTEVATGKSNAAIAALLFLTKRAVEKHINAIFMKLNLRDSEDTSRRVTAALIYLADADPAQTRPEPTTRATPNTLASRTGFLGQRWDWLGDQVDAEDGNRTAMTASLWAASQPLGASSRVLAASPPSR
jgi:DNA-binding NarL/FixJ family response regulator